MLSKSPLPQWGTNKRSCHWTELGARPLEAGSFPVRLDASPQNLDPCCPLRACATQIQPTAAAAHSYNACMLNVFTSKSKQRILFAYPLFRQRRNHHKWISDQQIVSEQLKLAVASPERIWNRSGPLWRSIHWPTSDKETDHQKRNKWHA